MDSLPLSTLILSAGKFAIVVALVEVEEDEDKKEDVLLVATGAEVVLTLRRSFRL